MGGSGEFGECGPSKYRALQCDFMIPFALALQDYAVLALEYAGLGVEKLSSGETIPHKWLTGAAQANDRTNAPAASRAAFPEVLTANGPFVAIRLVRRSHTTEMGEED
jgi:hypothetical protein